MKQQWPATVCRRDAIRIGGLGLLGLNLPKLLQAADAQPNTTTRAKSVVFLYQFGGPSHLETFDMKPDAPSGMRSHFGTIETSLPGLRICEHLPETAKVMHKVTLVRSMHHTIKNHNPAAYYALTGHAPPSDDIRLRDSLDLLPAYGSVVDALAPLKSGMPTFVAYPYLLRDGANTPGQHASFLGKGHDPLFFTADPNDANFRLPELTLPASLTPERLSTRREIQRLIEKQIGAQELAQDEQGLNPFFDKAMSMLSSPDVQRAFDLSQEPAAMRERYGRTTYGQSCLLARRLVEAGVKFVNVYFSDSIGGQSTSSGGWDTHGFNNTRMFPILKARHLPITEHTLPIFLNDLEERGLLDQTLVIWMGEFGRTPRINSSVSRDHWPQCYTALLAGGGVKRGHLFGESDRTGAFPALDAVTPDDLSATMYSLLGIDPKTEIHDRFNRPLPISAGRPIVDVIA